jgi:uncharacterized protein
MGNPVVYFEVGGPDAEPLVKFYGELFGWGMQTLAGGSYTLVATDAGGAAGGIGRSQTGEPWSTFYVEVDDAQAALDKAESLGARTVMPATEIPGMLTFAMFDDPDGLLVGLLQAGASLDGPAPATPGGPPVDWFEVLGSDTARTRAFYTELFGWTVDDAGPGYLLVDTGAGRGIPGGLGAGGDARWATVYASVPDVAAVLARAGELGGTREYGPNAVDDHMETGAFRDPAGNVFGVYHHAPH